MSWFSGWGAPGALKDDLRPLGRLRDRAIAFVMKGRDRAVLEQIPSGACLGGTYLHQTEDPLRLFRLAELYRAAAPVVSPFWGGGLEPIEPFLRKAGPLRAEVVRRMLESLGMKADSLVHSWLKMKAQEAPEAALLEGLEGWAKLALSCDALWLAAWKAPRPGVTNLIEYAAGHLSRMPDSWQPELARYVAWGSPQTGSLVLEWLDRMGPAPVNTLLMRHGRLDSADCVPALVEVLGVERAVGILETNRNQDIQKAVRRLKGEPEPAPPPEQHPGRCTLCAAEAHPERYLCQDCLRRESSRPRQERQYCTECGARGGLKGGRSVCFMCWND